MRHSWLVAAALAIGLTSGCADRPPPRKDTIEQVAARFTGWVGVVKESGTFLAFAVLDGKARGFVCDSQDEAWFDGQVS